MAPKRSPQKRRAQHKRAQKNIASAVKGGGQINLSKASDVTVDVVSRSKTSKQRKAAKDEQLKRLFR